MTEAIDTSLISWDQFFPGSGQLTSGEFGPYGNQMALEVMKALDVAPGIPHTGPGAAALMVEDLSTVLASAEMQERQLTLWNNIPKQEAYALDVEYDRLDTFGEDGMDGFVTQNDAGTVSDPRFTRGVQQVKYLAVLGSVGLVGQHTTTVGFRGTGKNLMDTSEEIKMRELLRHIERNLWWGDASVSALMWNGLFKQIDAGADTNNRIRLDLRGAVADKDMLEYIAQIGADNSTDFTDLYFPNEGLRDLRQSLFPQQRLGENAREGSIGAAFINFLIESIGGNPDLMRIHRNQMLTTGVRGGIPRKVPATASTNAPAAPTSVTGAGASNTALAYRPGLDAGTYFASVISVGKGGWSAATASSGVAATQGQKITWTINSTDANILYFYLFRNTPDLDGSDVNNRYMLTRIPRTGSAVTFDDDGYNIPNCYHVCGLSMIAEELLFKQLLPVVKRPLPQTLMGNSYGILCFGTPLMKVPTHNIHIANVGQRPQSGVASV